ncbi:MAG: carboxypeptidase regulatory-like domain-containing protein, partial [Acidobacteriota bacterium]
MMATAFLATLLAVPAGHAQPLDESCTVNILNRSVQVAPNGTFAIGDVPEQPGYFRVRAVCTRPDGQTVRGQSDFIQLTGVSTATIDGLVLGEFDPPPAELEIQAPRTLFTLQGQTAQFTATAILPGDQARNATSASAGTLWGSSDPAVVSVGPDGLVTAHSRGRAIVMARNEGVVGSVAVEARIPNDADGDGLPDEYERANGLNPNDAGDAAEDRDGDGLTNLQEFELGTGIEAADSDGDGLTDGEEVALGSDPVAADSDGDGLLDGTEVLAGTDLANPDSDGDGLADGLEVDFGLDPLAPNPTTTVTGRVVGPDGAAVPGATALAFGVFTAVTDAAGNFTIPLVPADRGDLVVSARSIAARQVSDGESPPVPPVAGGVTDVGTIRLEPVIGRVTGTVLSPRGEPVRNARVTVTSGADFRSTNSDSNGQYQVDGLPPGDVEAQAVDPGTGLRGRGAGTLVEGQSAVVDVRLTAAGTITGPVLGRDGLSSVGRGVTA